jgi:thiol-disulfide isomerase/thioredoxin
MRILYSLITTLILISFNANAYTHPKGLYVLEYPVNMPDKPIMSETGEISSILNNNSDLTVFVFWSQSCYPCLKELKSLEKLYSKALKDNIKIMIVSPSSEWKNLNEERLFLTKYKAPTIPFYNDIDNKLSLSLGIGSTPYTVIMDKNHKKVATIQGQVNWSSDKLYKNIKNLIK